MPNDKIAQALAQIDPNNDAFWGTNGQVKLDVVRRLAQDGSISRDQITIADPVFNRTVARGRADIAAGATQAPQTASPTAAAVVQAATPPVVAVTAALKVEPATSSLEESEIETNPDEDQFTDARAQLKIEQKKLEALQKTEHEAKKAVLQQQKVVDEIVVAAEKLQPQHPVVVKDYHKSQQTLLAQRANRMQVIRESGVDIKSLVKGLKAPIDSRKTVGKR